MLWKKRYTLKKSSIIGLWKVYLLF
jgi:hypothetical protein